MLDFLSPLSNSSLKQQGDSLVSEYGESFPIVAGIPRFVDANNYASAFGLQWKTHSKTQLDSRNHTTISRDRLTRCLGIPLDKLANQLVLEAGCGAGRFTELMVGAQARVHAIDLSLAVEANKENIGACDNYRIAQANIYAIPFADNSFDYVVCLGVLQHTPSPEASIYALWRKVKAGGWLVIDHYAPNLSRYTKVSTLLMRPILKRMPASQSKGIVEATVRLLFPLHWRIRKVYPAQVAFSRLSPVFFYYRMYPQLSREEHYELSQLDTYDSLTDYYKHLRSASQIRQFLTALGAKNIHLANGGIGVECRCQKPAVSTGQPDMRE